MTTLRREDFFDADFLESLAQLRIVASRVPRGGRYAEQRSADLGGGTDFKDFRPYSPGDDFRSIDWNIYQRLGRVVLKLFEELEDLPLYILVDVSRSLFLEEPPRVIAGLRSALALAAISLNHHDTVGVFPFSDDAAMLIPPQGGKRRLLLLADRLTSITAGGTTDLAASLRRFESFGLRRGLVAVVSDFFDPAGIGAVTEALKRVRHRLVLVQLCRPSDRTPQLDGDLRLVDCEYGTAADVSVTDRVLARYTEAYDRFQRELLDFARRRGAGLLRIDVERDLLPQLAALFERGVYSA